MIESQWNILQDHIQDSHDFTELVGFHQEYVYCLILYGSHIFLIIHLQLSLQRQLVVINYKLVLMHLISRYRYLSALISQSFLDIGSVSRILDGIMKLCLQFCWSIENQDSSSDPSELEHLTEV